MLMTSGSSAPTRQTGQTLPKGAIQANDRDEPGCKCCGRTGKDGYTKLGHHEQRRRSTSPTATRH
eukprot:12913887-Prorocentrum_lima.AAC.1